MKKATIRHELLPHLTLLALAAGLITLCSKSSPLYPLNDWVDANCFFTTGKSMLSGTVLYRDLYEQKGPLLYMLYAVCSLISYKSFFGVWLLEIGACYAFLLYAFRTIRLFVRRECLFMLLPVAVCIYTTKSFAHGGGAEELCLPLLMYGVYVVLKSLQQKVEISSREALGIGITSACVLWIKYSMLGLYLGWIVLPALLLLLQKKPARLFRLLGLICLGVLIGSLPIIIYFAATDAFKDLWTVYFYNNIFLYGSESTSLWEMLRRVAGCVRAAARFGSGIWIFSALGLAGMLVRRRLLCALQLVIMFTSLAITTYGSSPGYTYYAFVFCIFSIMAAVPLTELASRLFPIFRRIAFAVAPFALPLCLVSAFLLSGNTYLMRYQKEELPQYRFAARMQETDCPTLLNYGFLDGGFYTAAGIVPSCKFFCLLNINLPEMRLAQNACAAAGDVDYIITRDSTPAFSKYEIIDSASLFFEGRIRTYYLYARK